MVEIANSHLRNAWKEEGSFSNWDGQMKKNWSKLINPPLLYVKNGKEAREKCRWAPLPKGWAKLNFDSATRGNLGTTGIGCIINDDSGHWVAKKAMSIQPTSNNLAKLEALNQGLQSCHKLSLSKVIIEGDS